MFVKSEILDKIIPYTDLFITDIKHIDSKIHKECTGVGNEIILKNIEEVVKSNKPVVLRIPIIPNINDSIEHIQQIADFILNKLENRIVQVQFLRFRQLGEEKYNSLGIEYQMKGIEPERNEFEAHIKSLVKAMQDRNIPAVAGTTQKIPLK